LTYASWMLAVVASLGVFLPNNACALPGGLGMPAVMAASASLPLVNVDQKHGGLSYHRRTQHYLGYPGYPRYRHGYRYYNGWWYPPSAFRFGFNVVPPPDVAVRPPLDLAPAQSAPLAGPVVSAPPLSPNHYEWCDRRYRSYRASDNSFQPYKGPRRACRSPFAP